VSAAGADAQASVHPRSQALLAAVAIVFALLTVTLAVNLQLPLYSVYGDAAGSSQAVRALAFATYVVSLIPALAFVGGLSDVWGRKPVVLMGLGAAVGATAIMLRWPDLQALFGARLLQGFAVAISAGTCTAYLTDVLQGPRARARAAALTALTTAVGFGGGALMTSVCVAQALGSQLRPWSFPIELALLALAALAIIGQPARNRRTSPYAAAAPRGSWIRLPCFPAHTLPFTCAATAAWSVSGVIINLLPGTMTSMGRPGWSGLALSALTGAGVMVQVVPWLRPTTALVGLRVGAACTMCALVLLMAGLASHRPELLLLAAIVTGLSGFGFTYITAMTVVTEASGEFSARAISGLLLCTYVGFGLPCVLVGLATDAIGLFPALSCLAIAVGLTWMVVLLRVRALPNIRMRISSL
jgi:MFS family permease